MFGQGKRQLMLINMSSQMCLNFPNTGWRKQKQVKKQITKVMLQSIVLPMVYINVEQWNVSNMKPHYDVRFLVLIQMFYQRDKVCYFSNMNVISMMMVDKGKSIDQVDTMFRHLHRKLVKWITFQTKMLKSIVKIDVKKDVFHSTLVIEMLMQYFFSKTNHFFS